MTAGGRLKVGVVGVGYLGRFHAQKYAAHPEAELVGVADVASDRAWETARSLKVEAWKGHRDLIGRVDAASVVTPAQGHFEVARDLLQAGIHVLVEKPLTETLGQADELVALAEARGLILQVGLLERFNPAIVKLTSLVDRPRYIETKRLTPYVGRGTDVDVVLDLMIHDLDLALALIGQEPVDVRAVGAPLLSGCNDMANAWLEFPGGCVANLTAARVSLKPARLIQVFQDSSSLQVDCVERTLNVFTRDKAKAGGDGREVLPGVWSKRQAFPQTDPLADELAAFVRSVREDRRPLVDGPTGRRALAAALAVAARMRKC